MGTADQSLDILGVFGHAIEPEIIAEQRSRRRQFGPGPWQGQRQDANFLQISDGQFLGLAKRFVQAGAEPRMPLSRVFAHGDQMHDRVRAGLGVI